MRQSSVLFNPQSAIFERRIWKTLVTWGLLSLALVFLVLAAGGVIGLFIGPRLISDQDLLYRQLQITQPGYTHAIVLSRLPASTAQQRHLRIQAAISTPDGEIECQGLLNYHYRLSPVSELAWDTERCTEAAETVRLARIILDGGSLRHYPALFGAERTSDVIGVLRHWLANHEIVLRDIPGADNHALLE